MDKKFCPKHWQQHHDAYTKSMAQARNDPRRKVLQQRYDLSQRDKERDTFYQSPQWRRVRDYVFARDQATCQVCGNIVTDRKIVDHVHALKLSNYERLDTANLWVLCYGCHAIKTKLEQRIVKKPHGVGILTHADKNWWSKIIKERRN